MPRSALLRRLAEVRSPGGRACENLDLIRAPARGKVRVAFRQAPDRMQMIRKDNDRLDGKRVIGLCLAKRCTQGANVLRKETRPAIQQIDREEEAAASDEIASVLRHEPRISRRRGEVMGFASLNPSYIFRLARIVATNASRSPPGNR